MRRINTRIELTDVLTINDFSTWLDGTIHYKDNFTIVIEDNDRLGITREHFNYKYSY